MGTFSRKVGIDLGSSQTRIILGRKGTIVEEPSVVAKNQETGRLVAVGFDALEMAGRTPEVLRVYRPLKRGVIADFGATAWMIRALTQKAIGRLHVQKPEVMITVSMSATSTERRAVLDVAKEAGFDDVHVIYSPVAAALGAGIPITEPSGNMIIDIGGGTSEIAVLSLGGVVAKKAIRSGGRSIDEALRSHLRRNYGLSVGMSSAEELKQLIGCVGPHCPKRSLDVSGRSLVENLPKSVSLQASDIQPTIETALENLRLAFRQVIEQTPPELVADIKKHGVLMSGGGARLKGLDEFLSEKLNVSVSLAEKPMQCTVKGTQLAMNHLREYKKSLLNS